MDALLQGAPMALEAYGIWLAVAVALIIFGIGWLVSARVNARKIREVEQQAEKRGIKLAEKVDRDRKAAFLEVKNVWYDEKSQTERSLEQKRREFEHQNDTLHEKETRLAEQTALAGQREKTVSRREREVQQKSGRLEKREGELVDILDKQRAQLERISGMNADHAKEMLLENIRNSLKQTATNIGREILDQAKERADREA
ncbi:MAG: Rnase Y domain-containing protein, partial [Candidatus Latescibacteria bacterium]|nr:Rnase Y domain-containing protein [Candidatus Latescibacterota bacterium]